MFKSGPKFQVSATFLVLVLIHTSVSAQSLRTWVSGVGDDANPGSRTAPCKTFAGCISKTAAGGEIDCLDSGGFGAVTITKSITIDGNGTFASILGAGTNAIVVNAGVNDVITIRNLSINGAGTGLNGIRFIAGGELHIENCVIFNFSQKGVNFAPSGSSKLFILNTVIRNNKNSVNGGAVSITSPPGFEGTANLENVTMRGNLFGVSASARTNTTLLGCRITSNINDGIAALGNADYFLEDCLISGSMNGIRAISSSIVFISRNTITQNINGLNIVPSGQVISFGNNRIAGNVVNGSPTSSVMLQGASSP